MFARVPGIARSCISTTPEFTRLASAAAARASPSAPRAQAVSCWGACCSASRRPPMCGCSVRVRASRALRRRSNSRRARPSLTCVVASHRWVGIHFRRTSVASCTCLSRFIGVSRHLRNPLGILRTRPMRTTLHPFRSWSASSREGSRDLSARTVGRHEGGNGVATHHPAPTATRYGAKRPKSACPRPSATRATTVGPRPAPAPRRRISTTARAAGHWAHGSASDADDQLGSDHPGRRGRHSHSGYS